VSLLRWLLEPERPTAVLEVRPTSLGIASLLGSRRRMLLGSAASLDLPPGTIQLSLTQPNVADRESFSRVLATLLERTGLKGRRRVGLVLPDPVARVSLVHSSELSVPGTSLEDLIRFRLKKTVPFEVRDARIAHLAGGEGQGRLVVAIAEAVLRGYEDVLSAQGLEAGLVELSGLALAEAALAADGDRLLINWEPGYLSLFLLRSGWPILVRTLTGPSSEASGIAQEVGQTVVYYRERLGGEGLLGASIRCPADLLSEAVDRLEAPLGIRPQPIEPWAFVGGGPREVAAHSGLAGALASLRRAAA
jgi:hypothetical protein